MSVEALIYIFQSNMMEVGLTLFASNIRILLPTDLMGSGASGAVLPVSKRVNHVRAHDCLCLTVPELQLLVRMHDYFLGKTFSPPVPYFRLTLSRNVCSR